MIPSLSIHRLINQNKNEWFTCADITVDERIICGTDQGKIYLIESQSNIYEQLLGHTKLISDLCYYDSTGAYLLSCSADCDIRLWRSSSSQCLSLYRSHLSPVWCLAVHSKSDRFASGSMDQTVRLWTPDRPDQHLRTFVYHSNDVNTLTFHPNGKYIASGANDGLIVLWSVEQGQPARILKSSSSIEQLIFTNDGNALISISSDYKRGWNQISQWDIRTTNEQILITDIPSATSLLKPCQIDESDQFATVVDSSSLLFFHCSPNDNKEKIRTDLTEKNSIRRCLHLSSNPLKKRLMIITE